MVPALVRESGLVTNRPDVVIDESTVDDFDRDGAVVLRGVLDDWVETMRRGVAANVADPGPFWAENVPAGQPGRFVDDYCNWQRIAEFEQVARHSQLPVVARQLMRSERAQFFHDHVLVKEPGTPRPTPWHSDSPYYLVDGRQSVSFWAPLDPVGDATLRVIAGSHRWGRDVLPTRWLSESDFYPDGDYEPVPDPDAEPDRWRVLEWQMDPGDVVAFHFRAAHGARGNATTHTRRVLSLRYVGDDARVVVRPGPTSPPFPGHDMSPGDRLREDWFPVV